MHPRALLTLAVTLLLGLPAAAEEPDAAPADAWYACRLAHCRFRRHIQNGGLDVRGMMSGDDWPQLELLHDFPGLKDLTLSAGNLIDDDLVILKDFAGLEYLAIAESEFATSRIRGQGLKHLVHLPKLRRLGFYGESFGDELAERLRDFPRLTALSVSGEYFTKPITGVIGELRDLEELHLSHTASTDDSLRQLQPLQKLRVLRMSFPGVTTVGPGDSVQRSHINWRRPITDDGVQHLAALRNLRLLSIRGATLSSVGPLHQLPELEELEVTGTFTAYGLSTLGQFPALRKLYLGAREIDEEMLWLISLAMQLEELSLSGKVADAGLIHLGRLPRLKRLRLYYTGVTDAGIVDLRHVRSLEDLDLMCTRLGDDGMAALAELPKLRVLEARATGITDGCVPSLLKMPALRSFDPIETRFSTAARLAVERQRPEIGIALDAPP